MPLSAFGRFAAGFAVAGLMAVAMPAHAEIEKFMEHCGGKLCPFLRASIAIPDGWEEEAEATHELRVQMLLPKGQEFEAAPAKIYVLVRYLKDKDPLATVTQTAYRDWQARDKRAKVVKLGDVARANGKPAFVRHQFESPKLKEQGFETASLALDTDKDGNTFVAVICLSSNTREAYKSVEAAYLSILKSY
jgi:hypothetical protein